MINEKQNARDKERISDVTDLIPFPDEIAHLKLINDKLDAALHQANANVDRVDKEYMDAKRYMADYRGEIDPHEMFQNELALKQIDRTGAFSVGIWEKLAKLKESPYFARIDFQTNESQIATKHYIGRFAFSHENELLIIDWRAPFASMFYQIQLISPDSTSFTNGISVTSIQMSKGLEFDEVIIPNANSDTYQCDDDRSLLYIAATRAMHRLTLLYWGEPSRFLPRP